MSVLRVFVHRLTDGAFSTNWEKTLVKKSLELLLNVQTRRKITQLCKTSLFSRLMLLKFLQQIK